jgi:hypothetical protein
MEGFEPGKKYVLMHHSIAKVKDTRIARLTKATCIEVMVHDNGRGVYEKAMFKTVNNQVVDSNLYYVCKDTAQALELAKEFISKPFVNAV